MYLIDQGLTESDGSAKVPFTPSVKPDHLNRAQLTEKIIVFAESFGSGLARPSSWYMPISSHSEFWRNAKRTESRPGCQTCFLSSSHNADISWSM